MSNSSAVDTITNGIQDISALLPLLGTEQCEEHTGSALGKGYLYTSITPISIFGSLGIVKAGFNVLIASTTTMFPFCRKFVGAQWLDNGGFRPLGDLAKSIAFDPEHHGRFLAESNLEKILESRHMDNVTVENLKIEWAPGSLGWNIRMVGLTLGFSALGITPYLYIILRSPTNDQNPLFLSGWAFPAARVLGSAVTGIVIQIIIQIRILTILKNRLIFLTMDRCIKEDRYNLGPNHLKQIREYLPENFDPHRIQTSETCLWDLHKFLQQMNPSLNSRMSNSGMISDFRDYFEATRKKHLDTRGGLLPLHFNSRWMIGINILLRVLMVISLFLSIAGYLGSFNLIQNAPQNAGPAFWLGFEVILSVIRILVWASNPNFDDNEGITFTISLQAGRPDSTCNLSAAEVLVSVSAGLECLLIQRSKKEPFSFFDCMLVSGGEPEQVLIGRKLPLADLKGMSPPVFALITNTRFTKQLFAYYDQIMKLIHKVDNRTTRTVHDQAYPPRPQAQDSESPFVDDMVTYPWNLKAKYANPNDIRLDRIIEEQVRSLGKLRHQLSNV